MLKTIKGTLGLVILEELSVILEETHITMHFLSEIAHETAEKVCLPLQTLEFKDGGWGWQINDGGNIKRINRMPSLDTTNPSKHPVSTQKTHLCGLSRIL